MVDVKIGLATESLGQFGEGFMGSGLGIFIKQNSVRGSRSAQTILSRTRILGLAFYGRVEKHAFDVAFLYDTRRKEL